MEDSPCARINSGHKARVQDRKEVVVLVGTVMRSDHILSLTTHRAKAPFFFIDPLALTRERSNFLAGFDQRFSEHA